MTRPRPRRSTAVGLVLGAVLASAMPASAPARADDSGEGDKQISVVVVATTPTARPTPTGPPGPTARPTPTRSASPTRPAPGSASSSRSGPATVPSADPSGDGRPSPSASASGRPGEVGIGGVLYVSALSWAYRFSPNPFDGSIEVSFTVRNEYRRPVDGTATFWLTNIFGGTVGVPVTLAVTQLRPQESRLVATTIGGVAQWTFLSAQATFTPPPELGGVPLRSVTRQAPAFAAPWAVLVAAAIGVAGYLYRRFVRQRRSPDAVVEPEAA